MTWGQIKFQQIYIQQNIRDDTHTSSAPSFTMASIALSTKLEPKIQICIG